MVNLYILVATNKATENTMSTINTKINDSEELSLIANTGIQFFDIEIDLSKEKAQKYLNCFFKKALSDKDPNYKYEDIYVKKNTLTKDVTTDEKDICISLIDKKEKNINDLKRIDVISSLEYFTSSKNIAEWFPLPFFVKTNNQFKIGPLCWCRGYIKKNIEEKKYHLVIAFDTKIKAVDDRESYTYPIPTRCEVDNGSKFALCDNFSNLKEFIQKDFINLWLFGTWERFADRVNLSKQKKIEQSEDDYYYICHYLNLINLIINKDIVNIPEIIIKPFEESKDKVEVDLVLDIGNSRTCGLIIERPGDDVSNSLPPNIKLKIRDLSDPCEEYDEAFPSRVEFAYPSFTHDKYPSKDSDPFFWPSMVRVGFEAEHLSFLQDGTEGNTGLSSPKRYLWSETPAKNSWTVNTKRSLKLENNAAIIPPVKRFIEGDGKATFGPKSTGLSVFEAKYSRQSMMTFMILEIIAQAYRQINSIDYRCERQLKDTPRIIDSLIITVPPAMPKQEINRLQLCVESAVGIYWKSMGWDTSDLRKRLKFKDRKRSNVWPKIPNIKISWDEAICSQVVYLYNELVSKYKGQFEDYVRNIAINKNENKITLATIDIGGGTSDIVINSYQKTENEQIRPKQLFRESFKVAGDDILLQIIRDYIVKSIENSACDLHKSKYQKEKDRIHSKMVDLLGQDRATQQDEQSRTLRKQLTTQLFEPLAIKIICAYEKYGTDDFKDINLKNFGEILFSENNKHVITDQVLNYINEPLSELLDEKFSIMDTPLLINFFEIHNNFSTCQVFDICTNAFTFMAEIIDQYNCDEVIITGRTSKLPGILACFRNLLDLPQSRIVSLPLCHFEAWNEYVDTFGHILDPKVITALGAMILNLCSLTKINNFYLTSDKILIKSCIRYMGALDQQGTLEKSKVFFKDMDLDNDEYLPNGEFKIPGKIVLGYRCMEIERWPANPLYVIEITDEETQRDRK